MDRLQLQSLLKTIASNVYFQPPSNVQMAYPCIVYQLDDILVQFADNQAYRRSERYQLTVIDPNPDSNLREQVAQLPQCSFDRFFVADDLNHYVFTLFF